MLERFLYLVKNEYELLIQILEQDVRSSLIEQDRIATRELLNSIESLAAIQGKDVIADLLMLERYVYSDERIENFKFGGSTHIDNIVAWLEQKGIGGGEDVAWKIVKTHQVLGISSFDRDYGFLTETIEESGIEQFADEATLDVLEDFLNKEFDAYNQL